MSCSTFYCFCDTLMDPWIEQCMYVYMYVLCMMYVCIYVLMYVYMYIHTYVHMHVCMYVCMYYVCVCTYIYICMYVGRYVHMYILYMYTGCPRRNVPDFGRVFLMLKYTDITQNTYVQSWTVTEIMAREKCALLAGPHTVPVSSQSYPFPTLSLVSHFGNSADASHWTQCKCIAHAVQVKAALWMVGRLVVRCC